MNIQDELNRERRTLERLVREQAERLPKWEEELERAKDVAKNTGKAGEQALAQKQKEFDAWHGITEQTIDQAAQKIVQLEGQLKDQQATVQQRARAELDILKADYLKSWQENGGSAESFQEAWPQMERDILIQRTMEANQPKKPAARSISGL